jgi:hypothetical protein
MSPKRKNSKKPKRFRLYGFNSYLHINQHRSKDPTLKLNFSSAPPTHKRRTTKDKDKKKICWDEASDIKRRNEPKKATGENSRSRWRGNATGSSNQSFYIDPRSWSVGSSLHNPWLLSRQPCTPYQLPGNRGWRNVLNFLISFLGLFGDCASHWLCSTLIKGLGFAKGPFLSVSPARTPGAGSFGGLLVLFILVIIHPWETWGQVVMPSIDRKHRMMPTCVHGTFYQEGSRHFCGFWLH